MSGKPSRTADRALLRPPACQSDYRSGTARPSASHGSLNCQRHHRVNFPRCSTPRGRSLGLSRRPRTNSQPIYMISVSTIHDARFVIISRRPDASLQVVRRGKLHALPSCELAITKLQSLLDLGMRLVLGLASVSAALLLVSTAAAAVDWPKGCCSRASLMPIREALALPGRDHRCRLKDVLVNVVV